MLPGSSYISRIFLYSQDLPVSCPCTSRFLPTKPSPRYVARCISQGSIDFRSSGRPSKAASRYRWRALLNPDLSTGSKIKAQLRESHCMGKRRPRLALASAGEFIPCWQTEPLVGRRQPGMRIWRAVCRLATTAAPETPATCNGRGAAGGWAGWRRCG